MPLPLAETGLSLPSPQASLLGRARCALGYGIDSARLARRCGIDANKKSNAWQILFGFFAEMFGFSSKDIFSHVLLPYVKELSLEGSWKFPPSTRGIWLPFGLFLLLFRAESSQLLPRRNMAPSLQILIFWEKLARNQRFNNGMV